MKNVRPLDTALWHSLLQNAIADSNEWKKGLGFSKEYWVFKRIFNYLQERYERNRLNYINMAKLDIDLPNKQVEYWFRECESKGLINDLISIHAHYIYYDEVE